VVLAIAFAYWQFLLGERLLFMLVAPVLPFVATAYFIHQDRQSRVCHAVTRALGAIAGRHPTPELRSVVPDLKALAADRVLQDAKARRTAHKAVERIEALTAELQSLPVAFFEKTPPRDALPRPAQPLPSDPATLPRIPR
jgi:hypothetical protein